MPSNTGDELALRFVEMTAKKWIERGLPYAPLASAMTCYGLSMTAKFCTPSETAEVMRELAAAVEELDGGETKVGRA